MNKILTILICFFGISISASGQVGIGTSSPDASAALDITSSEKGLLMPRMSTAQRTAISSPANSLMVFDTDTNSYWSYIEDAWVEDKPGAGKFVDGAADDIAYYAGRVGIGLNAFSSSHKLFVRGIKDTDQTNTAVRFDAFYEGTGLSTATYGLAAYARNNSDATINYAIGSQGITQNPNGGGTINVGVGSWPQLFNTGNIVFGSATISEVYNDGTMGDGRGESVGVYNRSGSTMTTTAISSMFMENSGTVTGDAYGLWIGGESTGTVGGNSYALFIDTPFSNIDEKNFALYSKNTANSYFEGNVGFGEEDPQQKVHINGVMRLEPQASAPTGGLGDLYVSDTGILFFHNGTEWKAVQLAP